MIDLIDTFVILLFSKLRAFMRSLPIVLFVLLAFISEAQTQKNEGYFLFPINPGKQNYLAGTMGELRSSHFHAGLDIKTGGVSGLPVHAAAEGYISRIKISSGGYGHALYMSHPNGTTTVYAHLSKFKPDIAKYVLDRQYQEETFEIELFPERSQFKFDKGEVIAYSGNTGSSSGPHLHFEIRDSRQRILDPLNFNFTEIKDDIRPQMQSIAFVTLNGNARVNDTYGRYEFDAIKTGNAYGTRVPISLHGKIGIEVYAYDLLNGVYNRNGIAMTTLVIDGDTVFREEKTELSFAKQRDILVHMDYERYREGGRKFNKLWIDDGNTNDIYTVRNKGFEFTDTTHHVVIYMQDSYGNISNFETFINKRKVINKPDPEFKNFEIFRNHLHLHAKHSGRPPLIDLYFVGKPKSITPYRTDNRSAYYLWDLNKGLPDSIDINGSIHKTRIYAKIPSGRAVSFYNHDMDISFSKNSLFDTLFLKFDKSIDSASNLELFNFPHGDVPIKSSIQLNLKPVKSYPNATARVYGYYGGRLGGYMGGEWKDGQISFTTRDLGQYTIAEDTIAPTINPQIINNKALYFKIKDDKSGINSYKATINGEFILLYYEAKEDIIWTVRKDENIPLKGEFILEVKDNTGNKSVFQRNL